MQRQVAMLLVGIAATATVAGCHRAKASPASDAATLEQTLGVRVETLRRSAGGYMLDLRYRVLDAEKAKPFFDRGVKAYLHHQKSGARLFVPRSPKIGEMRSRTAAPRNFVIFANPGQLVSSGDQVVVVVGKHRSEPLTVQ